MVDIHTIPLKCWKEVGQRMNLFLKIAVFSNLSDSEQFVIIGLHYYGICEIVKLNCSKVFVI